MVSTTDAADWKMEVERVLPQLKVTIRTDNKVSKSLLKEIVIVKRKCNHNHVFQKHRKVF